MSFGFAIEMLFLAFHPQSLRGMVSSSEVSGKFSSRGAFIGNADMKTKLLLWLISVHSFQLSIQRENVPDLFFAVRNGPPVVPHYDISDTNSDPEVVNVDNLLAAAAVQEHNNHLDAEFLASNKLSTSHAQVNEEINVASSDSEVEIVGVQEHA
ncbi:hypothetical protein E2320_017862, partial [Naja naja]